MRFPAEREAVVCLGGVGIDDGVSPLLVRRFWFGGMSGNSSGAFRAGKHQGIGKSFFANGNRAALMPIDPFEAAIGGSWCRRYSSGPPPSPPPCSERCNPGAAYALYVCLFMTSHLNMMRCTTYCALS